MLWPINAPTSDDTPESSRKRSKANTPPSGNLTNDPGLSSTACRRCRGQKLRCTREVEGCKRCIKQNVTCVYPPPPDRKLLNQIKRSKSEAHRDLQTEAHNGALLETQDQDPNVYRPQTSRLSASQPRPEHHLSPESRTVYSSLGTHTQSYNGSPLDGDVDAPSALLPPRTLGLSLLELYWSRFYKSSLLFYKPQLFSDYMEGRLPDYLLRSLFAVASLLLVAPEDAPPNCSIDASELMALAPFRARGRGWFDSALKETMPMTATSPSLHVCQALSSLMMFAFQTGEGHYADMILTLNYRCCTSLRRDKKDDFSLESELSRRVLWETWSCYCVAGDPKSWIRNAWAEVASMPLPAMLIRKGYEGLEVVPNEYMDEDWHGHPCRPNAHPPGHGEGMSLYASYFKLIGIWSQVQLFAAEAGTYTFDSRLERIAQLSALCDEVHESDWAPRYFDPQEPIDQSERLDVLIASEAMYRLCEMVIHSAVVPRFAGRSNPSSAPVEVVQAAAERVVANATALAEMFERYHQQQVDLSITVGIAGYAAFIAGCTLTLYSCTRPRDDPSLPSIRTHVVAVLNLLNILDRYWKVLINPHKKLKEAAEYYGLVECATPASGTGVGNSTSPHAEDARFDKTPAVGAKLRVLAPGYVYRAAPGHIGEHLYGAHMVSSPATRAQSPSTPGKFEAAEASGAGQMQSQSQTQVPAQTQVQAQAQTPQVPATPAMMTPSFDPAFVSFPMDWWNLPSPKASGGNAAFDQLDSLGFVFDSGWT